MRTKIIEKLFLLGGDILMILFAFAGAYFLRLGTFSHSLFPFNEYIERAYIMTPLWIFFLAYQKRYSLLELPLSEKLKNVVISSLLASLMFPMVFFFTNELFFSRGIIIILFLLGVLFLFFLSYLEKKISQYRSKKEISLSRMLVIGSNKSAELIVENLIKNASYQKPVAILSPYGSKKKEFSGVPILGKLDALEKVFISKNIDEVFLCEGIEHSENLSSFCRNKGIPLRTSLETLGIYYQKILAETIEGTTFLTIYQSPLFGWGQFYKRMFDVVFSLFFLIIFSPYFWIHRKNMTKEKFKNGKDSCFSGYIFQDKKTKQYYGRTLSLLINVLLKDMSIVGPQNMTSAEYNIIFTGKEDQSAVRFILRPGVFSPNSFDCLIPEKILRSDILYIKNWSFIKDMKLLFSQLW